MAPEQLRAIATLAIEAATQAGAAFADIRVSEQRTYQPWADYRMASGLRLTFGYGIRVWANGGEAFVGSADPTPEGIARAARSAVATARDQAPIARARRARRPIARPVVTGEWTVPVEIDPFQLSPDDHIIVKQGLKLSGRQAGNVTESVWTWQSETRVFAASDGSLTTQRTTSMVCPVQVSGGEWISGHGRIGGTLAVPGFEPRVAGVEAMLGDAAHDRLEATADELAPLLRLPVHMLDDVGRRDLVLDGPAFSALVGHTLLPALRLSRALGEEHDTEGPGFLGGPDTVVGQPLFAPALNLWVEAAAPHYGAAKWDDEGMEARTVSLMEHGAVVRYLGTRENASAIAHAASSRATTGESGASTMEPPASVALGVGFAQEVMTAPAARPGAVTVRPAQDGASLAALAQHMQTGLLMRGTSVHPDPRGGGGVLWSGMLFDVKQGHIVRRILGGRVEFSTKRVLHDAILGGPGSVGTKIVATGGGLPFSYSRTVVSAPAALVRGVGLVRN